jgi:FMN phosphatase YigB (HAD superfamily)
MRTTQYAHLTPHDRGNAGAPAQCNSAEAFARAEIRVDPDGLDDAHYRAAAQFTTKLDVDADWAGSWRSYLVAYADACGVTIDEPDELHRHLDSEFADAALWLDVADGAREGLQAIADTGVVLGVVSNADGVMATRLRELEILQVGPGLGIEVGCVVDSGAVGVMKPDPRIFEIALTALGVEATDAWYIGDMPAFDVVGARRAGLRPFVMDPLGLHRDADYDRVASLTELAGRIAEATSVQASGGTAARASDERFDLASARRAAARGETALWVGNFLATPGSDNAVLAAALARQEHWWAGPLSIPVEDLERLAGPETDALCKVDDEEWGVDIHAMEASIEAGWDPPPLLAEFQDGRLLLQDGNHRYEALVREGAASAWVLVYFGDRSDRDHFTDARQPEGRG